jgi:hypothetical protein
LAEQPGLIGGGAGTMPRPLDFTPLGNGCFNYGQFSKGTRRDSHGNRSHVVEPFR